MKSGGVPLKQRRGQVALIVAATKPYWVSCQSISANLRKAYQHAFGDAVRFFENDTSWGVWKVAQVAKAIFAARPNRLVFLDHPPHPDRLLQELRSVYGTQPLPPLYFHIYGDFTLYTPSWLAIEKLLRSMQTCFVCASERQGRLVGNLMVPAGRKSISVCAFPVNTQFFRFDKALRQKTRKRLDIPPDEHVFMYSGRMSLQKNVVPMVQQFIASTARLRVSSRLLLAGFFDDLGAPFFGIHQTKGQFFQIWSHFIKNLPAQQRKRIVYLGNLSGSELVAHYNASDIGLSLSLHHDEDFGMAPVEALCTGSRMILSDWGGYAAFRDQEGFCTTVPVRVPLRGSSGFVTQKDFSREILRHLQQPLDVHARAQCARRFSERFAVEAIAKQIQQIHEIRLKKFAGFGTNMRNHAQATQFARFSGGALFPRGMRLDGLYRDIYRPYLSEEVSQ
jgi:glycosyltransferase involved in cell wall biosynthesis